MTSILLDENLPQDLRHLLRKYERVATAVFMGWASLSNGNLLAAAEKEGFTVFLTGDKRLRYQQNIVERHISLVILSSNRLQVLTRNLARIELAIDSSIAGSFQEVECA